MNEIKNHRNWPKPNDNNKGNGDDCRRMIFEIKSLFGFRKLGRNVNVKNSNCKVEKGCHVFTIG